MDAIDLHNLIECPQCGAKLPPPGADGSRTCEYCETVLTAAPPQAPAPPPPMSMPPNLGGWSSVSVGTTAPPVNYVRPARSSGCGIGVLVVTIIIITAISIPIFLAFSGGSFKTLFADKPDGRIALAPTPAGVKTMFTLVKKGTSNTYSLVRLDTSSNQPIWTTAELSGTSLSRSPIVTDGTTVFLANDDKILAFRADNGLPAWQSTLTDGINTSCKDCMFVTGGRLVVEAKNYDFRAFDTATGAVAWDKTAKTPSAHAYPFDTKTMFLDQDEQSHGFISLILPDGSEETTLQPVCPSKDSPRSQSSFDPDAVVVPLPDENAAVFGFGSPYQCWQRIDFATGQPAWNTRVDSPGAGPDRDRTWVVHTGNTAAVVWDKTVAALDLDTGAYNPFPEVADSELYPLGIRENTVVLQTATTRGTKKYSIHAVDLTSGQEAWSIDLGTSEPAVGPSSTEIFLTDGKSRFTGAVDGRTFHLVKFDHDSRQLTIHNVPMVTGKDVTSTIASGVDSTFPYFDIAGWQGATLVASYHDGGVMVLDTATSTITYRYP